MRKKIFAAFLLIIMVFTLTACHKEHTLTEATCTVPATCTECGQTVGMPLGHEWTEPTCTVPATCIKCSQTKGETIPHTYTDANFQECAVCKVCGYVDGTPLEPGFVVNNLTINALPDGASHDYVTRCNGNSAVATTGKVRFGDFRIFASDEEHEALDGYEWRSLLINMSFSDDNAWLYGPTWAINIDDYYDIEKFTDQAFLDENNLLHFTVNWYGEDYSDCVYTISRLGGNWSEEVYTVGFRLDVRIPVDYDGIVVVLRDTGVVRTEGMYVYAVADENTLMCRLDGEPTAEE